MAKVVKLDSDTINKIAAGEVVERPASVVKELVENSIDAGASRIEVEIHDGGKSLIRVTDDGCGMDFEDAALAVTRHATSKINCASDLESISSLGFRGEALPTILSVSHFRMLTRTHDSELGTFIDNKERYEYGCAVGTTIFVEDLFFNTPARKKFLKTSNTEGAKIHDYVLKLALSRPNISFKLINGKRNAFNTPGNDSLSDTLLSIYGQDVLDSLLPINFTNDDKSISLSGFIATPHLTKSYRSWQTFIVNGRVVNNRVLFRAVDDAFRPLVHQGGYPLVVLSLSLDPTKIDVNVHPRKDEIRFDDEGVIYRAIYSPLKNVLEGSNQTEVNVPPTSQSLDNVAARPLSFVNRQSRPSTKSFDLSDTKKLLTDYKLKIQDSSNDSFSNSKEDFSALPAAQRTENPPSLEQSFYTSLQASSNDSAFRIPNSELDVSAPCVIDAPKSLSTPSPTAPHNSAFRIPNSSLTPLGQVDRCYILATSAHDLFIIDQHAAHERILFDRFSSYTQQVPAQQLLIHQFIKFDHKEAAIVEQHLDLFEKLGFSMIPSGDREFRLTECPVDLASADASETLQEILASADLADADFIARNIRHSFIATTACRAAIKAGHELNITQMQKILDQLSKTSAPFTCPHGRPTIIKFSSLDLAKLFKRTGF